MSSLIETSRPEMGVSYIGRQTKCASLVGNSRTGLRTNIWCDHPSRLKQLLSRYTCWIAGLLQLMSKWMFGDVNWYFLLTHSKRY